MIFPPKPFHHSMNSPVPNSTSPSLMDQPGFPDAPEEMIPLLSPPSKCQFPFPSLHFQSQDIPRMDSPGLQRKLLPVRYPIIIGELGSDVGGLPGYASTKFHFQREKKFPPGMGIYGWSGIFLSRENRDGKALVFPFLFLLFLLSLRT